MTQEKGSVFTKNLKFLRKRKGLSQLELADKMNMKRSTLSGYENSVSQPTTQALMAFSTFFNISVDTLLKVNLSALSEKQVSEILQGSDALLKGSHLRVLVTSANADNEENIELVQEKAKAGYATGFADAEFIDNLPRFQLPFLSKQKKYRTFQLSGDSMLPIPDKAWVTGEFLQDWTTLQTGQAYIVVTLEFGVVFKIIEDLIATEGIIRLYSLNPMYEPFNVSINDVKEIWKFTHFISTEIPDPVLPQDELLNTVARLKKDMDKVKLHMFKPDDNKP
jgi:transcriptional regulator with XRE-family HTH domain